MDHRINQVLEKIIKEYMGDGYVVNINNDDQNHLKNVLGNISMLQRKGEWSTAQNVINLALMDTGGE